MTDTAVPVMVALKGTGPRQQPGSGHQPAHGGRCPYWRVRQEGVGEAAQGREVVVEEGDHLPRQARCQRCQPRQTPAADRCGGLAGMTGQSDRRR